MTGEVVPFAREIDTTKFKVAHALGNLLNAGFLIRANTTYENHRYKRMATIFDTHEPGLQAPSYGTGQGPTVEHAIIRALYVNARSKSLQGRHPDSYPEAEHGPIRPKIERRSQLDYIFDTPDAEVWLYQESDLYIATSSHGQGQNGERPLEIIESDPIQALASLATAHIHPRHSDKYMDQFPPTFLPNDNT